MNRLLEIDLECPKYSDDVHLATNWFIKYRARAIAIILVAGGVVGQFVPFVDRWMIENHGWRTGWMVIAGISLAMAAIAAVFVRDAPEPMGQHPDGIDPATADQDVSRSRLRQL